MDLGKGIEWTSAFMNDSGEWEGKAKKAIESLSSNSSIQFHSGFVVNGSRHFEKRREKVWSLFKDFLQRLFEDGVLEEFRSMPYFVRGKTLSCYVVCLKPKEGFDKKALNIKLKSYQKEKEETTWSQ